MSEHRMSSTRHELMEQLVAEGLVQMGPTGSWEVTHEGRDVIDRFDLLRGLDERDSGPGQSSSPWREVPSTQEPKPSSSSRRRGARTGG